MSVIQKRKRGGGKAKAKDKGRGGEKAEDGNKDRKKRQSTETQPSDGERSSEESVHSVGDEEDTLAASVDGNGDAVPDDALLGSIMAKILKTKVPSDAAGTPVLSRRRAVERKMEDEKLELKARAIVRNELREKRDAAHQPPRMESANYEKTLRKVSTSGGSRSCCLPTRASSREALQCSAAAPGDPGKGRAGGEGGEAG